MLTPLVDKRCDRSIINIVQPSTDKWEALNSKVNYRRRKIEFAIKPWLDSMLVGRGNVFKVICHQ